MNIDLEKIGYTILGGVAMMIVTKLSATIRNRVTGRDALVKYSTFIKRHARNRREIENLIFESRNLHSIVMQGVDAAYIALMGKDPSVVVLYLRKEEDARLFRSCLDFLDDPEMIYAIATRYKQADGALDPACAECKEIAGDVSKYAAEGTWFRLTHGREATDEKIDEAMLEQVISLARSRDQNISQSGACHISVKMQGPNKLNDIIVLPTSTQFRKTFKAVYKTDDLTRFAPRDLFDKILAIRRKLSGVEEKPAAAVKEPLKKTA